MKKNTAGTLTKTVIVPPGIAIVLSLLYKFFNNWYEQGDIGAGTAATAADIWGSVKKGWSAMKSYPNNPNGFLLYLKEKYGDRDYKNDFKLTPPGSDKVIIITDKNGVTKSFKHNGRTYIEL